MDGMYRYQRHIYDLTRKYYLLGRDQTISNLDLRQNGTLLEVGCGTGRNSGARPQALPIVKLYGLDISQEMLISARKTFAGQKHERPTFELPTPPPSRRRNSASKASTA
jgi:S-adenosylmethionine-diacylgycerolhomoserine-N-methlytransferase